MKSIDRLISESLTEDIWDIISDEEGNEVSLIDKNEISAILGQGGAISEKLPGYEARDSQVEMAWEVAEAFNSDRILLVEAGTGVGKSMAYLIPSILWAVRNRERVVVSTNTINLQEQLTGKDIPFLRSVLDIDFSAVLVKGRGNYACLRKARDVEMETEMVSEDAGDERREILEWVRKTTDGSKSDLGLEPGKEVWGEFQSDPDTCLGRSCAYFSQCFFYKARREASSSEILVVNHRLLLSDLAIKGKGDHPGAAVLPPFSRLIIDEAHHLEDVSTDHFSASVSKGGVLMQLGRLMHRRDRGKGLLPFIASKVSGPECRVDHVVTMIDHVSKSFEGCKHSVESTFDALYRFFSSLRGAETEIRIRIDEGVRRDERWDEVAREAMNLLEKVRSLARGLRELKGELSSGEDDGANVELLPQILELGAVAERLEATSSSMENILFGESEDAARWVAVRDGDRPQVSLCLSPINAGGTLYDIILRNMRTVVMTSATLSVKGDFGFMRGRMGIDLVPENRITERLLPSTFNYKEQVLLCISDDMPEPTDPRFPNALSDVIPDAIKAAGGGTLVLFTSYSLMERLFRLTKDRIGHTLLKQGDAQRHELLERFKNDGNAVLFGTESFWEGVDVRGNALRQVIITRLPFSVPDDPVAQARQEEAERKGGNPFMDYLLPLAVMKFRQGFGRLIRSKEDRGVVLILDVRAATKGYGRVFLRSIPECKVIKGDKEALIRGMRDFLNGRRS